MPDVWRPRSDCLTNSLSFQVPCFWWSRVFELMLSLKSGLAAMSPPWDAFNGMIQIQQTETYAKWFAGLRDRVARARIDIRIRRLSNVPPPPNVVGV